MPDANVCPRCGSKQRQDEKDPDWMRCQNRQCRNLEWVPTRKGTKPAKRTANKRDQQGLGSVTVPDLDPPLLPGTIEDWEGAYAVRCALYAGYQHFRERAGYYWKEVTQSTSTKDGQIAGYRARLCGNLASTLAQVYRQQTPNVIRKSLREQRAAGHVVGQQDRTWIALMKRYSLLMRQAISKLSDDPLVKAWRANREALGDYDYLRKARKGLERGVVRPYRNSKLALADFMGVELASEGMSLGKIQETLKAEGLPSHSRQGILKRLKSHTIPVELKTTRSSKRVPGRLNVLFGSVAPVIPPRSRK